MDKKTNGSGKSKKTGAVKMIIRIAALLAVIFIVIPCLIVKCVPRGQKSNEKKFPFAERLEKAKAEETAELLFGMIDPVSDRLEAYKTMIGAVGVKEEYGDFVLSMPEENGNKLTFSFLNGHDSGEETEDFFVKGNLRYAMLLLALSDELDSVEWTFPEGSGNADLLWTRKDADKYFTDVVKSDSKLKDYTVSADGIQLLMNEFGIGT